jgi:hypothetical protein
MLGPNTLWNLPKLSLFLEPNSFFIGNTQLALTCHTTYPWLPLKPFLYFFQTPQHLPHTTRSMIKEGVEIDVRGIFKGYPSYFE